jgi:c(7)-type cytochrome triheme protein
MLDRRTRILGYVIGGSLAALVLAACSAESRQKILSIFFDGTDTPPPPTTRVRRDFEREIEELKRKLAESQQEVKVAQESAKSKAGERIAPPIEKTQSWEEAEKILPKDKAGKVDWVQALKARAIAPRPSPNPADPEQAVLDLDIELASSPNKLFGVTFSHSAHTSWLACVSCHPAIFPLRQAKPTVITMAKIQAGQYCGVCHGRVAFSAGRDCSRCHTKNLPSVEWRPPEPKKPIERAKNWEEAAKLLPVTAGTTDWVKALAEGVIAPRTGTDPKATDQPVLPLDVERVPAAGEMFKVIFPHKTHTEWLACPNCHTGIFQMAKGTAPMTMEKINAGQYCGVCHGKVAFPATACARCHPAMAGGKP